MQNSLSYSEILKVRNSLNSLINDLKLSSITGNSVPYINELAAEIKHYDVVLKGIGINGFLEDGEMIKGIKETESLIQQIRNSIK